MSSSFSAVQPSGRPRGSHVVRKAKQAIRLFFTWWGPRVGIMLLMVGCSALLAWLLPLIGWVGFK